MGFTSRTVQYNTNPYAPGFNGAYTLVRSDLSTKPVYYSPASSYLDFWYPRCAKFWKIPKGSKNIRLKIPHWYTHKAEWTATFTNIAKSLHPDDVTRPNWLKIPQNMLEVADQAASVLGISPPDHDMVYTMQDEVTLSAQQIASFCQNCNASIQVFHTNGRLLTGTPLRNWNVSRGCYWGFGYRGMIPTQGTTTITPEMEAKWRKEGLWATWYEVVQTSKAGKDYFADPNPGILPPDGTVITPEMITSALKDLYPDIFPPAFVFDDSSVNGTGLELLKMSNYSLNTISVDNETIAWSGNVAGATGAGSGTRMDERGVWPPMYGYTPSRTPYSINPAELLEIPLANDDLIIGVICSDYVGVVGYWDEYTADPPLPSGPYVRELGDCPATLRYHPVHTYQAPYAMTSLTCTDRLHKKQALYFPTRDQSSCIELRAVGDGTNKGGKRIYLDHSFWYEKYPSPVELMDMTFGYDYQRLYVLYKQSIDVPAETDDFISGSKHYRAWITMYNTNMPDGAISDSRVSIPLYGFIKSDLHIHPYVPTNIDTVLGYMGLTGLSGELIDKPELAPTFNILATRDKLFATIPCIFRPINPPDGIDDEWWWRPRDARLLCQLLYMFDEIYATFNNVAIIGAVSPWLEEWQTPLPDIEPKYPLKLRMSLNDEMVMWTLADLRKHPKEYYDPSPTKDSYPNMFYAKNAWDGTELPDRFWQPLNLEAVKVDDLVNAMTDSSQIFGKPVKFRGTQVYVCNPVTTDMYSKSAITWEGQRVFGTRDHFLSEDHIVYHNFRRQILTGVGPVTRMVAGGSKTVYPEQVFNPITSWEGTLNLFPYSQSVTLEPGDYTAYLRGADGAPAIDGDSGTAYASGGQGATVQVKFTLTKPMTFDVYVGEKGTSYEGGHVNGGNGSSYVVDLKDSVWNNLYDIRQLFQKGVSRQYTPPIGGFALFFKVPAGSRNVDIRITGSCPVHNASLQVFHEDGKLLTGDKPASGATLWSWYGGNTATSITNHMRDTYGSSFPSEFFFDDSEVNEGLAGQVPYSSTPKTFHVEGETIQWTGNRSGGMTQTHGSSIEELFIEEAKEDLIIGVIASHIFDLYVDYSMPAWEIVTPALASVLAGGGGGLTGIFLDRTPIFIAGSGGGGGNPVTLSDGDPIAVTEANGGHGGDFEGGYGTLLSTRIQRGGSQSNGYRPFIGQDAIDHDSGAGGGGAGYYGGTASQLTGIQGSGGGGGSSFILGATGYGSYPNIDGLRVTSYTVTPGNTPPWSDPQDGKVIISGTLNTPKIETVVDYQFISHDLGDMYYQCASGAEVADSARSCGLNVIILNDCTTSMAELILTLSGAMPDLIEGVASSDYGKVQYAVVGYANDEIIVDTMGEPGYFTDSEFTLKSRMQHISELVQIRTDAEEDYPGLPFGWDDAETWADAVIQAYNQLQPSLIPGNIMFVIVTDDINDRDNPVYKVDQAQTICTSHSGSLTWVLPVNYPDSGITASAQQITTETSGVVIKGMSVGSSDWGGVVAQSIAEAAPAPTMVKELRCAHIFSIENLSCNTYMCDVTLTSTKSAIKLGYLPHCDSTKPLGIGGEPPSLRTLHWDEIPPHVEAYFMISYEPDKITIPGATVWNGHSYKIIEQSLTWAEARTACEEMGGHLVDILSQEEEDFVESMIDANTIYHIGGYCPLDDNTNWEWVTGEAWDYTNWKPGEPGHTGDYVCFWNDGTKLWHDGNVGTTAWFICEWDYDEIPVPAPLSCEAIKSGIKLNYYLEGR